MDIGSVPDNQDNQELERNRIFQLNQSTADQKGYQSNPIPPQAHHSNQMPTLDVQQSYAPLQVPPPNIQQDYSPNQVPPPYVQQGSSPNQVPPPNVQQGYAPNQVPPPNVQQGYAPHQVPPPNVQQGYAPSQAPPPNVQQGYPGNQMPPPNPSYPPNTTGAQHNPVYYGNNPQQPGSTVVVVQQHNPPQTFVGHIVFACAVFWCCGWLFGLIAFIFAMVAHDRSSSGDAESAKTMGCVSLGLSIAGLVIGIILYIAIIVVYTVVLSNTCDGYYC